MAQNPNNIGNGNVRPQAVRPQAVVPPGVGQPPRPTNGQSGNGNVVDGASKSYDPLDFVHPLFADGAEEEIEDEVPFVKLSLDEVYIDELLTKTVELGCSDLHLAVGKPPCVRLHGKMRELDEYEIMRPAVIQRMIYDILTDEQIQRFENEHELDFAYTAQHVARFRVNAFRDRTHVAAAMRVIPSVIPSSTDLDLPPVILDLAERPRGLMLVTGPTGSGKSTTLAAVLDTINRNHDGHIITIEDPIEFVHPHKRCVVNQREVGSDTKSFSNALRSSLREDPDVILVGELRDNETIHLAITAAETGHLVSELCTPTRRRHP
jgi:twitching motility protein PilT